MMMCHMMMMMRMRIRGTKVYRLTSITHHVGGVWLEDDILTRAPYLQGRLRMPETRRLMSDRSVLARLTSFSFVSRTWRDKNEF